MEPPDRRSRPIIIDRYVAEAFAQECDDVVFLMALVRSALRDAAARCWPWRRFSGGGTEGFETGGAPAPNARRRIEHAGR
jgi:hypothetical protein